MQGKGGKVMSAELTIDVGLAKTEKYASRESGDTAELVERPGGGFSIVLIDGQGSGRAAKTLSLLLSSKAVGLLKDGVRDGAVARATHDHLYAFRHGQVSATFDLLSVDMKTRTVVITRNAESPMLIQDSRGIRVVAAESGPIGRYQWTRPDVTELPLETGLKVTLFTDGIPHSGLKRQRPPIDFQALADEIFGQAGSAKDICNRVIERALQRDDQRPGDDMAVVTLCIHAEHSDMAIRRLSAQFPMP